MYKIKNFKDFIKLKANMVKIFQFDTTDAPLCSVEEGQVHGALKQEAVELSCTVDSNPHPSNFEWVFNRSGDQSELPQRLVAFCHYCHRIVGIL